MRRCAGLVLVAISSVTLPARAVDRLQGIGQISHGFTDNVQSSPDEPVEDVPPKSADMFTVLSPQLVYARLSAREAQTFKYTFAANLFYDQFHASSFSNRLEWLGHFTTSRHTELLLSAAVTQEQPYTSPTFADAATQTLRSTLPTTESYVIARADETLTIDLDPFWRAYQGLAAGLQVPTNPAEYDERPKTYEVGGRVGIEHVLRDDAFGPEVRSRYTFIHDAVGLGSVPIGNLAQVINEYLGVWRHDWGSAFTSRAEAGAVHVISLTREREFWHPAGSAMLAYGRDEGRAALTYNHTVRTNLLLGQLILIAEVSLSGGIPVDDDDEVWISTSIGYQRGRLLGPELDPLTRVDVVLGDVGVAWQADDHVMVAGRYQHIEQISEADAPPLPLSYVRNTVMATVTLKWPPDREMPRRYRAPLRVDQEDALIGQEPTAAPIPGSGARR